jgi:glycosyltransferase involved in cell wall biosynthesis
MLTHNAPDYVEITIRSVAKMTDNVQYELVVLDNASDTPTRELLRHLADEGLINKLRFLDHNALFSAGNNLAARIASVPSAYFLLLNSDVEVRDPEWLSRLLAIHRTGMTAYGLTLKPARVDGWCALIDADLYRRYPLDESHQWWWSIAKQQAQLLRDGFSVQGYREHERYIHHFGGKSGHAFRGAQGMQLPDGEMARWFDGCEATILDPDSVTVRALAKSLPRSIRSRLRREVTTRISRTG